MSWRRTNTLQYERVAPQRLADLTPRHQDIVRLVAAGLSNAEIARRLGLSVQTVKNYVTTIYQGLRVPIADSTRTNRVILARWYWSLTEQDRPATPTGLRGYAAMKKAIGIKRAASPTKAVV